MFFGMGNNCGRGGNDCCIGGNSLMILLLLSCTGCGVNKDDILELLFLVMLLECFGCGFGCGK